MSESEQRKVPSLPHTIFENPDRLLRSALSGLHWYHLLTSYFRRYRTKGFLITFYLQVRDSENKKPTEFRMG